MTTAKFYDTDQVDGLLGGKANTTDLPSSSELVPDASGASNGDVLTIVSGAPAWAAPGGSGGITRTKINSASEFISWATNAAIGDIIWLIWAHIGFQINGTFMKGSASGNEINFYGTGSADGKICLGFIVDTTNTTAQITTYASYAGAAGSSVAFTINDSAFDDPCYGFNFRDRKPITNFQVRSAVR